MRRSAELRTAQQCAEQEQQSEQQRCVIVTGNLYAVKGDNESRSEHFEESLLINMYTEVSFSVF